MESTQQIEFRWKTPGGRINPRKFRHDVGFALGAAEPGGDWAWLFNEQRAQPPGGGVATCRFVTGENRNGAFASIISVGDEACNAIAAALPKILPAMRAIREIEGHPHIEYGRVWWKTVERPMEYRAQTVVLTKLRGDRALYDRHRADPSLTIPFLKEAVATGLSRMATRIGLADPEITPDDVGVKAIDRLGAQPVGKGASKGYTSRLTQAFITLPIQIEGDWRVGGLLTYGNGLLRSVAAERHWRDGRRPTQTFPRYQGMAA